MLTIELDSPFPAEVKYRSTTDDAKPIIQFKAPNSGVLESIFPEFEVQVLRENNNVFVVSGERAYETRELCEKAMVIVKEYISDVLPNAYYDEIRRLYISSDTAIVSALHCGIPKDSPFTILEWHFRDTKYDRLVENAWSDYFASKR